MVVHPVPVFGPGMLLFAPTCKWGKQWGVLSPNCIWMYTGTGHPANRTIKVSELGGSANNAIKNTLPSGSVTDIFRPSVSRAKSKLTGDCENTLRG